MKKYFRLLVLMTVFLPLLVAQTLPLAAQSDSLPAPTGPHQVGVTSLTLVDEAREELFTSDADDSRAITIFAWYPADVPDNAAPSPYLSGFDPENSWLEANITFCCAAQSDAAGIVTQLGDHQLHAFQDVPVAGTDAGYPVVIYSNILSGTPITQSMQLQELASHGYIVIDLIHTFGYVPDFSGPLTVNDAQFSYQEFEEYASADLLFVLDLLDAINASNPEYPFAGHLNLDQIGLVGWSSGGWPVINAANEDSRVKAGIIQDGSESDIQWSGNQPFMFLAPGTGLDPNMQRDFDNAAGPAYLVEIEGLSHMDFSDAVLWPRNGFEPPQIDGARAVEILNAYVLSFFDQHLKGEMATLLDGISSDYPETVIQIRNT